MMMRRIYWLAVVFLAGCVGAPEHIQPVDNFELQRYLGTWYEIARLDHSFERGLEQVTANYSLRDDGGVKVINKGFNATKSKWKQAEGKAYFVKSPDIVFVKSYGLLCIAVKELILFFILFHRISPF